MNVDGLDGEAGTADVDEQQQRLCKKRRRGEPKLRNKDEQRFVLGVQGRYRATKFGSGPCQQQ